MTIMALKRVVVIKGVIIHISTSQSLYPGDVGCHRDFSRFVRFKVGDGSNIRFFCMINSVGIRL
jgi:hypothetical protein